MIFLSVRTQKIKKFLKSQKKNNYKLIYNNNPSGSNVENALKYAFEELDADYAIEVQR